MRPDQKDVVFDLGAKLLVWAGYASFDDDGAITITGTDDQIAEFCEALGDSTVPVAAEQVADGLRIYGDGG
jgi:hypothetical protein